MTRNAHATLRYPGMLVAASFIAAVDWAPPEPPTAAPAPPSAPASAAPAAPTLEETRLALGKWIETQQIISKERNEWQQGREILQGRLELVAKEVDLLREKIAQGETAVADSNKKRDDLIAENYSLKAVAAQLGKAVESSEKQVRALAKLMPDPVTTKLLPLMQRIPADAEHSRVSTAERFQNVLGILNELNKANSELSVAYEIRTLADGSSSEVQVVYVGLAQAYYLSPRGEAGVGRPTDSGWEWHAKPEAAAGILSVLEELQGKRSPSFVPLPISIQ